MRSLGRRSGGWRARLRHLALVALAMFAASSEVQAQSAPQHWLDYARSASSQFQIWLSDGTDERVMHLHAWLQQRDTNDRLIGVPTPVVTQVWIARDGQVQRIEFASLGEAQADADLRALLSRRLPAPPPDMRQPVVLQLSLDPAPASVPGVIL